jgi:hypothetical protein
MRYLEAGTRWALRLLLLELCLLLVLALALLLVLLLALLVVRLRERELLVELVALLEYWEEQGLLDLVALGLPQELLERRLPQD